MHGSPGCMMQVGVHMDLCGGQFIKYKSQPAVDLLIQTE